MATATIRGKAAIEGVAAVFDVILYPEPQSAKLGRAADEETIKDRHGATCTQLWRDEHYTCDLNMKLLGDTTAHATTGADFLALGAKVTISTATAAKMNGEWQVLAGDDIDLGNTKVGDINFKLRRFKDDAQNALLLSTPA